MAYKLLSNLLSSANLGTNLVVGISLVVILLLVYLKNNNFELFAPSTTQPPTSIPTSTPTSMPTSISPSTTPASSNMLLLNNDVIQNSALVNFINRFIINKKQQNVYSSALVERQGQIDNLSEQVIKLINSPS